MTTATLSFFPVGNGDMTLLRTEDGHSLLIDVNIRVAADDQDDDTPDVAQMLRHRLKSYTDGRPYVDALLISHPDKDHCTGLRKHFHLGSPDELPTNQDKIFIREIWSSPTVFRRASRTHNPLCEDAKAFNTEARRRVKVFRDTNGTVEDGDRILILGEDEGGKTDDLKSILIQVGQEFSRISGKHDQSMIARLLGPIPETDDEDEDILSKNNSSTIIQFSLTGEGNADKCRLLTGGDAEVAIWERIWKRYHKNQNWLSYDVLLAPHHCSWHSLSWDSWSELREAVDVCEDARNALSQARPGATIVASSNAIKDDDKDPPCIRAKREYCDIVADVRGAFECVGERPSEESPDVLEFEIGPHGHRLLTKPIKNASFLSPGIIGRQPLSHG